MRATEQVLPSRPASLYTGRAPEWLHKCLAMSTAVLRGIEPYLSKSGSDNTARFTYGSGTTGLESEAYCAGWVLIGDLLQHGYSLLSAVSRSTRGTRPESERNAQLIFPRIMYVAVLLVTGLLIAVMSCNASAAQAPDVGGVLRAVSRNYCLKGKPADRFLNPKVARINDSPASRDELFTFFGDAGAVDEYFRLNAETAVLPEHLDYSCFQLDDHGLWAWSIPAFSKSGDTAFVYVEYNCPALCGHGEMYILNHMSGRWKVTQVYKMWVS